MIIETVLAAPDLAPTVSYLAQGSGGASITESVNNFTSMVRTIGLSIMGLMVVLVAVMIAIAALRPEGAVRKNMTAIGVLLLAGFVLGGGTAFVGYMVSAGGEVTG